jgi:gliding motility associated protien GldN
MPKLKLKNLWVLMAMVCTFATAQPLNSPPQDLTTTPVELEPLRQADIAFQWTIERIIDTREKQNLALNWPKNSLKNILFKAILNGEITAYENDSFTTTIADTSLAKKGEYCYLQTVVCEGSDDASDLCEVLVCDPLDYDKLVKWKVIEQWYFDKEQSRMIPRIIGLALMYRPIVAGLELPETPLFWVKYDDARPALAQNKILNPKNEQASMSYDHFFNGRYFSSYIIKYPNVHDYYIGEMEEFADNNTAALLQAEETKKKLFEMEHDQWEY